MEVRIAVIADFASVTDDQKLNILGVFRNINALQVPATHPQFKLVTQFEFNSSEAGEKQIKFELVDEDGSEMLSISGRLKVGRTPDGKASILNQVVDFTGLTFPKFGEYEFRILLDALTIQREETTGGELCYVARHPELPNCIAQGDTPAEAEALLKEATEMTIRYLAEFGLPIPQPETALRLSTSQAGSATQNASRNDRVVPAVQTLHLGAFA